MEEDWALVGREAEAALVRRTLGRRANSGLMLAGGPGVGKSRMLRECAAIAGSLGFEVVRAVPNKWAANVPFGALALLLPESEPGVSPAEVLRRTAAALAARGKGRPVLILVDDAHLLDDASATLIHQVVLRRQVCVAVALPTATPAPDAILNLWKDGLVDRVELTPLGPEAARELLEAVVGGPVHDRSAEVLLSKAAGNALFLREVVVSSLEAGTLTRDGDEWRLAGEVVINPRLVAVVESRLGRIDEADRETLEVVALGEPITLDLLEDLVDRDRLEHLERLGLITVPADHRAGVRLTNPLQRDVLIATVTPTRRRAVSRALADRFEQASPAADAVRIATWRLDAGDPSDSDALLRAARAALRVHDPALATRLAQAADGFEAVMITATARIAIGDYLGAEAVFAEAALLATSDEERAALAGRRAMNLLFDIGRPFEAYDVISAVPKADDEGVRLARLLLAMLAGQQPAEVIERRLTSFTEQASGAPLLAASIYRTLFLTWLGRFEDAVDAADRGRTAYASIDFATQLASPYALEAARCVAQAAAGHVDRAAEAALAGHAEAVAAGSLEGQRRFAWVLGLVNLQRGRVRSAVVRMEEALAARPGMVEQLQIAAALAIAKAQAGQGADAAALLEALPESPDHWWMRARAWVAASEGHVSEARRCLQSAARTSRASGLAGMEAAALHDLARIGAADEAGPRLDELRAVIQGPLHVAQADYAAALARVDAEALGAASVDFEHLGAHLLAAEAAHAAALEWRRRGLAIRAAEAEERVALLMTWCEAAYSPGLAQTEDAGLLSPREREVAQLAVAGLDNSAIAERLGVSKRTIASQLHRVYQKLGVGGRAELADRLAAR